MRKEIEDVIRKKTSFVSNTESRADAMEERTKTGHYSFSKKFSDSMQDVRVSWWPKGASRAFPGMSSQEVKECQPFVDNMFMLFAKGTVEIVAAESGKDKSTGKNRAKQKEAEVVAIKSVPDPDAVAVAALGRRSPDVVFFCGRHQRGEAAITILAEVSGGARGEFPPELVGQLTDRQIRLLKRQSFRQRVIGFLTDGRRFLFVECIREGGDFTFHHSGIFTGEMGWQIVFGLMAADPGDLGYVEVTVPGYSVEGLLGTGASAVVMKARASDGVAAAASGNGYRRAPRALLPPQWTLYAVEGEGNCLFHALAHQLQTAGVADEQGRAYTPDLLRALALSRVDGDSGFRLMMSDEGSLDLARLTGYVAHDAIAAMAAALDVNIVIHGVPGGGQSVINADGSIGSATSGCQTLRIVYNGLDHYDSVLASTPAVDAPVVGVDCKRARTPSVSMSSVELVRRDLLPVAVKIFSERHRRTRDLEQEALETMKISNNVPTVVQSLDVCDRPALVLSPAGDPVLPITNGVRANKTDFVKLLQVLSEAHSQDICHRDVKPENIFKDENGRVILSDWGSAATAGESVPWQGTRFYYDAPAGRYHTPEPADDLMALVRSVFAMYTNDMPSERTTNTTMEASSLWRGALQCARKSDYGGLQDFFNGL